jgi:hypothetical protein
MLHHRLADSMNLLLVLRLLGNIHTGRLISEESSSLNFGITYEIHFRHIQRKRFLISAVHHHFQISLDRIFLHHAMLINKLLEL